MLKLSVIFSFTQFKTEVMERRIVEFMQHMPEKKVMDMSDTVIAPMPGLVKSVGVVEGQAVSWSFTPKSNCQPLLYITLCC